MFLIGYDLIHLLYLPSLERSNERALPVTIINYYNSTASQPDLNLLFLFAITLLQFCVWEEKRDEKFNKIMNE